MGENVMETMIKETAKVQQKLLKGFENLINIKDVETGMTPKELVYQEDKVQLFHYDPGSKKASPVPLLVVYALFSTALHVPLPQGWIELTLRDHGFSFIFR